jgi:hypothetical protein
VREQHCLGAGGGGGNDIGAGGVVNEFFIHFHADSAAPSCIAIMTISIVIIIISIRV